MKKLVLFVFAFLAIMPIMHKGKFTLVNVTKVYAQNYGQEDGDDPDDPDNPDNPDDPDPDSPDYPNTDPTLFDSPCGGMYAIADQSFPTAANGNANVHLEHSGFIGLDPDGNEVFIEDDSAGNGNASSNPHLDQYFTNPDGSVSRTVNGVTYTVESVVHTHPNTGPGWQMSPDPADEAVLRAIDPSGTNVTGIVLAADGTAYTFGITADSVSAAYNLDDFIDYDC